MLETKFYVTVVNLGFIFTVKPMTLVYSHEPESPTIIESSYCVISRVVK